MSEVLEILLGARAVYAARGVNHQPDSHIHEYCLATAIDFATGYRCMELVMAAHIALWHGLSDAEVTWDRAWRAIVSYNDTHTKAENLAVLDRAIEAEHARCAAADRVAAQVTDLISAAQSAASAECKPVA